MKFLLEYENKITIYAYKRNAFNIGDNYISANVKWFTPRLGTLYNKILISKFHIAEDKERDLIYIPKSDIDAAKRKAGVEYESSFPTPYLTKEANFYRWNNYLQSHKLFKD